MKSKKILTILLSLAIMFTFMPAMAFADSGDTAGAWDATYSNFTPTGGSPIAATKSTADSSGMVTSSVDFEGVKATARYIDLASAKVVKSDGTAFGANVTVADYNALIDSKVVSVRAKTGTNAYATDAPAGWKFTVSGTKVATDYVGSQDITLSVAKETTTDGSVKIGEAGLPALLNADGLTLTLHVVGSATTVPPVLDKLFFDAAGKKEATPSAINYTGAEQTLYAKDATNYTVSYQKWNTSVANWEAVSAITVNEVKKYGKFRAVYTNKTVATDVQYGDSFDVEVKAVDANKPSVGFDSDYDGQISSPSDADKYGFHGGYYSVDEGYDATSFIKVTPAVTSPATEPTAVQKAVAAANEADLLAYFNDFYEIKKTTQKAYPGVETLKISKKEVAKADYATLKAKYATLVANLGLTWTDATTDTATDLAGLNISGTARVIYASVTDDKDDDITFSGVTTKSFKAKKKTKKLAKAKSFQIAAVADSGNAITFTATTTNSKIKVSSTGKVTVKKGLKKGTYKVTVKAKTAAGNGYKACKESKTYTIKIK